MGVEKERMEQFAVIELLGHRKIVGLVQESDIAAKNLLRVDVLDAAGKIDRTEYIGTNSIYCLTIVSKEAAIAIAAQNVPLPAWAWNLPAAPQLTTGVPDDNDAYEEGCYSEDDDDTPF